MNGRIEARLEALGLWLPPPLVLPSGTRLPFATVCIRGHRALISGHGPQSRDGTIAGPFGRLGDELSASEGYESARLVALSILGSLHRTLGTLDRVQRWVHVFGMVRSSPQFSQQPAVLNGFSDLIVELYGDERGEHARTATGVTSLAFGIPIEIEGEVEIDPDA